MGLYTISTVFTFFTFITYSFGDVELRAPPNIIDFFPNIKDNLTKVSWAHAVNSASYLEEVLEGGVMMIEADVVLGTVIDDPGQTLQPVMGHPPNTSSDLSLRQFLDTINEANLHPAVTMKGVKLDFKSIEVFEKSLGIIDILYEKVQYPLWINADILPGPVDSQTVPVDAGRFLSACERYPAALLSIGWTTSYGGDTTEGAYTGAQVAAMLQALQKSSFSGGVTFPVRAGLAANSLPQILDLLSASTGYNSTLTVWSSQGDYVDISKLTTLISDVGLDRVYLDVPEEVSDQLNLYFHTYKPLCKGK